MSSTAKEVIRKYMKKVKPLYDKLSQKQSTTATALKTESSHKDLKTESSFSGNLMKYTKRGRCAASCPSSMRSSPSHSGVLTRELQSAIQGAIAHCKNSMLQKSLVSSHEI
ncbi:putative membrane-associated kinase regulator 1 [Raphanus sativus]|nr:putative membrane-associated kinase regulator 1 [Raphanus sativus]